MVTEMSLLTWLIDPPLRRTAQMNIFYGKLLEREAMGRPAVQAYRYLFILNIETF